MDLPTDPPESDEHMGRNPAKPPEPAGEMWNFVASLADRKAFLNQLGEGVIIADVAGRIIFVNDLARQLHGQARLGVGPEQYSETYRLFTMAGDPFPIEDLPLTRAVRHGEITRDTRWRIRRADGTEILAIGNARPLYDDHGRHIAAILTIRDDTQRHADEQALEELVRAKDVLLHEVNHRVKNSLQLVTSLLSLQASRSQHDDVRQGLLDASKRIAVIARIHQRLYSTGDHDAINLGELLCDLARDNVSAHGGDGQIAIITDCDSFNVGLDQAVPLALCATELITNAVKYAFAGRDTGTIRLSAKRSADGSVEIIVADDGIGLPPDFDPRQSPGLGMRIVNALVSQLRADFDVASSAAGSRFILRHHP
ncbi:MAG: PAS domain S-box protein [Rhodobacteraceae bacterium]|nr:PAS domain S-box protein [Paracoccaceae bacterium]